MKPTLRVVKVGGSLFSLADMPDRIAAWGAGQPAANTIYIGGGGDLVAPLRAAHERFGLNEDDSHWLAVRAMTVTSRLLAKLLNVELVERIEVIEQVVQAGREAYCVLDVEEFLRTREPVAGGTRLPYDWSCTSDSIAARVAELLHADELVVMKSISYPSGLTLAEASAQGLVDGHFPIAVAGLPHVRWVNLTAPVPVELSIWRERP